MYKHRRTSQIEIIIDARKMIDSKPLALEPVLKVPWIVTFLDMIAEANALDRMKVVAPTKYADQIYSVVSDFCNKKQNIIVITEMPHEIDCLVASVEFVYARTLFVRTIRRNQNDFKRSVLCAIEKLEDIKIADDFTYRDAPGHRTVVLRYVYRPIGRWIAFTIAPTTITPNMISFTGLLLVPVISVLIAVDNYLLGLLAAALFQILFLLDIVDGVLARITKRYSKFGHWLDTMIDMTKDLAICFGFGMGVIISTNNLIFAIPFGIWLVGLGVAAYHDLIETAAQIKDLVAEQPLKARQFDNWFTIESILYHIRRPFYKIAEPDISLNICTLGLIFNLEIGVLFIYAFFYGYKYIRLFQSSYLRYRQTEFDI